MGRSLSAQRDRRARRRLCGGGEPARRHTGTGRRCRPADPRRCSRGVGRAATSAHRCRRRTCAVSTGGTAARRAASRHPPRLRAARRRARSRIAGAGRACMSARLESGLLLTARILVLMLPLCLLGGRVAGEAALSLTALLFVVRSVLARDWAWTRTDWFKVGAGLWLGGLARAVLLLRGAARRLLSAVMVCAVVSVAILALAVPRMLQRHVAQTAATAESLRESPYGQIWHSALHLTGERPLVGVGMKNFRIACDDPVLGLLVCGWLFVFVGGVSLCCLLVLCGGVGCAWSCLPPLPSPPPPPPPPP